MPHKIRLCPACRTYPEDPGDSWKLCLCCCQEDMLEMAFGAGLGPRPSDLASERGGYSGEPGYSTDADGRTAWEGEL